MSGSDSESSYSDESWADAQDDTVQVNVQCLCCAEHTNSIHALVQHTRTEHKLDLHDLISTASLDTYDAIRLVNYCRTQQDTHTQQLFGDFSALFPVDGNVSERLRAVLADDAWLKPVRQDDELLFEIDGLVDSVNSEQQQQQQQQQQQEPSQDSKEQTLQFNKMSPLQLQRVCESMHRENVNLKAYVESLQAQVARFGAQMMQDDTPNQTHTTTTTTTTTTTATSSDDDSNDKKKSEDGGKLNEEDSYYFSGYSDRGIHRIMLQDYSRTVTYLRAMLDNPAYFEGRVVMDVGCGTGILSLIAARAGAKHVYAVDNATVIDRAKLIARHNEYADKITFIRGRVEDIKSLPGHEGKSDDNDTTGERGQVDIVISEWMGYFLFFESMLNSVIYARDRFTTPLCADNPSPAHVRMYPSHCRMFIAPVTLSSVLRQTCGFWKNVYGFDMSAMLTERERNEQRGWCVVTQLSPESVLGDAETTALAPYTGAESKGKSSQYPLPDNPVAPRDTACLLGEWDLNRVSVRDLAFTKDFSVPLSRSGKFHGFAVWFDVAFGLTATPNDKQPKFVEHILSTGPLDQPTHWKQTVFFTKYPCDVVSGDVVQGRLSATPGKKAVRDYQVAVEHSVQSKDGKNDQQQHIESFVVAACDDSEL